MMTSYWRFTYSAGELCGPCAWVMGYNGLWRLVSVHESGKRLIQCVRCERTLWTVASHTLPVVAA